jgi:hypothetical protein
MNYLILLLLLALSGCTNKAYYEQQPDLARQTTANTIAAGEALSQIAAHMFPTVQPNHRFFVPPPPETVGKVDVDKEGSFDIQIQPPTVVNTGAADALQAVLVAQERTRQVAAFTALVEKVLLRPQHQVADPFSGEKVLTEAIKAAVPIAAIGAMASTMKEGLRSATGPVTATVSGGSSLATETGTAKGEAPTTTTTTSTSTELAK